MIDPRETPALYMEPEPEGYLLDAADAARIIAELEADPDAEPYP